MNFLNPMAFWLLLLVIPVVIFFLLKVRLTEKPVSTMMFWREVFEERRSRVLWRRLRLILSLLFCLAFMGILILAISNPRWYSSQRENRVILFDQSASMNAKEKDGTTRFELAKRELNRLHVSGEMETALLTSGGRPGVVCGWTSHPRLICNAAKAIVATDTQDHLNETLELANQLAATRPDTRIYVLTDGCDTLSDKWLHADHIVYKRVGTSQSNTAITRFQPRRSFTDSSGYEVLIEVIHYGTESVNCRLELALDGNPVDVIPLTLQAGKPETRIISAVSETGGVLTATVTGSDALPQDNTVWAVLPDRVPQQVLYRDKLDYFLTHVLQSQSLVALQSIETIPNELPKHYVLVLEGKVPNVCPQGNLLIINPESETDLFRVETITNPPLVASQDEESPIMRFVHLKNVAIPGAKKIIPKTTEGSRVLLQTPEGDALCVAFERPSGKVLVLSADPAHGDLALRTAFPLMITNTLVWFRGEGGEFEPVCSTGDFVTLPVTDSERTHLRGPSDILLPVITKEDHAIAGPLNRCGLWRWEKEDGTLLRTIACNMNSAEESNLSVKTIPDSAAIQLAEPDAICRPLWFWLIVFAIAVTLLEWYLYQRRWID